METCTITGTLMRADATPLVGQQIVATIRSTQDDQGGQVIGTAGVTSDQIEAFTNIAGKFEIDLLQGGVFLLEIPAINLRKQIAVPVLATVDFIELI